MSLPFCLTLQGWRGRGLALIIGAIAVLGHAPFHFWPLTLISLAWLYGRLIWAARQTRAGRAGFGSSFWWALGYFAAGTFWIGSAFIAVSYTHLRAHETEADLVCRLLLEKKKT